MNQLKFQKDLQFGLQSEKDLLPTIRNFFNDQTIERTTTKFSANDYFSSNKRLELKSRTFRYDKYETTMIGLNKVKDAIKFDGEYYFLFKFTDGLYFIKYEKELFDTFQIKMGGRQDRNINEFNKYVYIPIEYLEEIQ